MDVSLDIARQHLIRREHATTQNKLAKRRAVSAALDQINHRSTGLPRSMQIKSSSIWPVITEQMRHQIQLEQKTGSGGIGEPMATTARL